MTIDEAKAHYEISTSNHFDFDKFIDKLFADFGEAIEDAYERGRSDGWEECVNSHT